MNQPLILVGDLAGRCGITTRALRVYERRSLIAPVERGRNGYRLFDPGIVPVIKVFSSMLSLGLSLNEVGEAFGGVRPVRRELSPAEWRDSMSRAKDVYERHITAIDAELERLASVRTALAERIGNCVRELTQTGPVTLGPFWQPKRNVRPGRIEYVRNSNS